MSAPAGTSRRSTPFRRVLSRVSWLVLLAGLGVLGAARSARAEQAAAPLSSDAPVLVVDSSGVDDIELPAALRELCSRVGIRVAAPFETVPGRVLLLAHIRAEGDSIEISVEDAETHALVGRRSVPRAESQALSRETLAHVLLGLVEPWIERARRAEAEAQPAAQDLPSQPAASSAALAVWLGLGAGPIMVAREQWGARVAGHASFGFGRKAMPTVALDVLGTPPVVTEAEDVRARFWLVGARLRGRVSAFSGARGSFDLALSGGVDLLGFKPVSAPQGTRLDPLSLRAQGVFGAALGGRVHLPRHIDLVFGIGADVDPKPRAWMIDAEGARTTLLRTAMIRPYALLGLDFTLRDVGQKGQVAP